MTTDLAEHLKSGKLILFAGAGVSATVGVPTWRELISRMAEELGFDDDLFDNSMATSLTLAEYYASKRDGLGALASWMDRAWDVEDDKLRKSVVHKLIADLGFYRIYTTNYDRLLEKSLRLHGHEVEVVANIRDMARADDRKLQVVKLHGDFDDTESIVLTETAYYDRLAFDMPLDVKFRSDALSKPMLFIGYSLSDLNMRLLLHKLTQAWKQSELMKHRPPLYLFLNRPDEIQQEVLSQWGVQVVTRDVDDPKQSLATFLEELKAA